MFRSSLQMRERKRDRHTTRRNKTHFACVIWFIHCFDRFGCFHCVCVSHRVALSNDYKRNVDWHLSDMNTFAYDLPNSTHRDWRRTPTQFDDTVHWRCHLIRTCAVLLYLLSSYLSPFKIRLHFLYNFDRLFAVKLGWHIDIHLVPAERDRETTSKFSTRFWIFVNYWITDANISGSSSCAKGANKQSVVFRLLAISVYCTQTPHFSSSARTR